MSNRGESSEAAMSRHATAENAIVGGTIILLFLRAYASNSNWQYYRFLATFGDDQRLRALRQKAEGF
ncbi:MAG: hypothetical protein RM049_11050 [Nostoc sp. DedQUE04]|uniref:hypothetical protein n=1 Tax=Nostoc sp. DedQUE04 TaxID=3075390 RepID=UPI002AD1DA21|nr:hypothetical protein [Nostoc sp. DedQUE04]MDZ8135823.1 hypothetical protein [Nostoc sp. DedQUE04]